MPGYKFPSGQVVQTAKEAVLEYLRLGMSYLTPVAVGSKKPILKEWQRRDQPVSEIEIKQYWDSPMPYNIGLVCGGESGVVCLDIDKKSALEIVFPDGLPTTLISFRDVEDGERKYHIFFKYNKEIIAFKKHGLGFEVLSNGNYVLLSPRIVLDSNGKKTSDYFFYNDYPITEMPAALIARLNRLSSSIITPEVIELDTKKLVDIPPCINYFIENGAREGERNECCHMAGVVLAFLHSKNKISRVEAAQALLMANNKSNPPLPRQEVINIFEYALTHYSIPTSCQKLLVNGVFARGCASSCKLKVLKREVLEGEINKNRNIVNKEIEAKQAAIDFCGRISRIVKYPARVDGDEAKYRFWIDDKIVFFGLEDLMLTRNFNKRFYGEFNMDVPEPLLVPAAWKFFKGLLTPKIETCLVDDASEEQAVCDALVDEIRRYERSDNFELVQKSNGLSFEKEGLLYVPKMRVIEFIRMFGGAKGGSVRIFSRLARMGVVDMNADNYQSVKCWAFKKAAVFPSIEEKIEESKNG